jgi:hypothetical protein
MKIAGSVWLSLYMRNIESVQHLSQFSTLNSAVINDIEGQEKYNNTEV